MDMYLKPTEYFDYQNKYIQVFAENVEGTSLTEKAISIYYLVRDTIKYNPYTLKDGVTSLKASYCLENHQAYCIPKSALMIALCRYHGIPARLGLADVINHLSSPKLIEWLKTDYFAMHGYVEVYLEGKWVKATPVFDQELCTKFGVYPLDFDGKSDSILQANTTDGKKHMEYVKQHGTFEDMPVALILQTVKKVYPHLHHEFTAMFNLASNHREETTEWNQNQD
ncbi:transglutaminase-like domain-containing protein [Photobacterium sanguinicancri]|uniref:transglutaminase-like domain-containing protein n=1 Tax=Photobacterium sanguinicancri TaxID=875932 RepID=UPI003D0D7C6C